MDKSWGVIALLALLPVVWSQCLTRNDTALLSADKLNDGQRKFSVLLLNSLREITPNESLVFSPHSVYRALLLTYFGANGDTEKSLAEVLRLDWAKSKADVAHAFVLEREARVNRAQHQTVEFNSVDKLYFDKRVGLSSCVKDMFSENIEQLDFSGDPEGCRRQINALVEKVTQNHIKNLFPPESISPMTELVVANAVFFKGQWMSRFQKKDTSKDIFYEHGEKPVSVEMMKQRGDFVYGVIDQLQTEFLKMPYKGEDGSISMFIFLPICTPTAIDELLAEFTPEILDEAFMRGGMWEVDVEFPKLSFERTFGLVPVLNRMGVGNLFEKSANLSGFSETTLIKLDSAVHKAKIEIDEEGSVAAAATAFHRGRSRNRSMKIMIKQFKCNHPFMFLIHDQKSKEILFAGVYRGPSQ